MSRPTTGTLDARSRREPIGRALELYCLAAGACDFTTGVLLIAAPFTVLGLMGVALAPEAAGDGVYLRYIGTFVAAVGASYLYPVVLALVTGGRAGAERLPTVLEVTALVRGAVALFVTAAVARGALATPWLLVAAVDGGLAVFQIWLLRWATRGGAR